MTELMKMSAILLVVCGFVMGHVADAIEDSLEALAAERNFGYVDRLTAELQECRENLMEVSLSRDECEKKILYFEDTRHELKLCKEEHDLIQKELSIGRERLDITIAELRACESRSAISEHQLELKQIELERALAQGQETERLLRQNDCEAIKSDLRVYRERAETANTEQGILQRKLEKYEQCCTEMDDLLEKLENAEIEKLATDSSLRISQAEAQVAKQALESLLASLDVKQQFEALQKQHEQEWLPFWISKRASSITEKVIVLSRKGYGDFKKIIENSVIYLKEYLNRITKGRSWNSYVVYQLVAAKNGFLTLIRWPSLKQKVTRTAHNGLQYFKTKISILEQLLVEKIRRTSLAHYADANFVRKIPSAIALGAIIPPSTAIIFLVVKAVWKACFGSRRSRETVNQINHTREKKEEVFDLLRYTSLIVPQKDSAPMEFLESLEQSFDTADFMVEILSASNVVRFAFLGDAVAELLASMNAFKSTDPEVNVEILKERVKEDLSIEILASGAVGQGLNACVKTDESQEVDATLMASAHDLRYAQVVKAFLGGIFAKSDYDLSSAKKMWNKLNMGKAVD